MRQQNFKENLFRVSFSNKLLPEHVATYLFEVIKKTEDELIIKRDPASTNNEILNYFISHGLQIQSFNELLPSLNEIFIRQVEGTPMARQFQEVTN